MKPIHQLIALLARVAFFTGCSSSPSAEDGEKAMRQQIDSASGGQITLIYFKKTDGQKLEASGIKGYKLEFEGEIEFASDGTWLSGGIGMPLNYEFKQGMPSGNVFQSLTDTVQGGQSVRRGSRVKISGTLGGEKTENGWRFKISESRAISQPTSGPSLHTGPVSKDGVRIALAKEFLFSFNTALDGFKVDNDYYPKGKNGLLGLIKDPGQGQNWRGPYLQTVEKDPWGHDWIYDCPGQHNPGSYDLMSMGPDGRIGGGDDIANWR